MPAEIALGIYTVDEIISQSVEEFSGSRWGLLLSGSFGGGTLSIRGGVPTDAQAIQLTDLDDGTHTILSMTSVGLYLFTALCSYFEFELASSTAPSLTAILFPESRGYHL